MSARIDAERNAELLPDIGDAKTMTIVTARDTVEDFGLTVGDATMSDDNELRRGERAVVWELANDAALTFIGKILTPWNSPRECPRQGQIDGPLCEIVIFKPWNEALQGVERYERLQVLYWLHQARRDLVVQSARHDPVPRGTFALRSPIRPNPVGSSIVKLERRDADRLLVRGLDCLNRTPLLDIKPEYKQLG